MNKKGQLALVSFGIGIIILLLGLAFVNPIKDVITPTLSASQLDCANSTISDGQKLTCLGVDLLLPYFIIVVFGIAGAYFTAKWVGG